MNICEVTIKQATFKMETKFTVHLSMCSDVFDGLLIFQMESSSDRAQLQKIFDLTGMTELSALCSKKLKAFGHISEDKFFSLKNPLDLMHKDEVVSFINAFAAWKFANFLRKAPPTSWGSLLNCSIWF